MSEKLTARQVREAVNEAAREIAEEIKAKTVERDQPHDAIFEATDSLFGSLVRAQRVDSYNAHDLAATADKCAVILEVAEQDAWVADDSGLWEGLTHGVLAAIAFHSLENCIWETLRRMDIID